MGSGRPRPSFLARPGLEQSVPLTPSFWRMQRQGSHRDVQCWEPRRRILGESVNLGCTGLRGEAAFPLGVPKRSLSRL